VTKVFDCPACGSEIEQNTATGGLVTIIDNTTPETQYPDSVECLECGGKALQENEGEMLWRCEDCGKDTVTTTRF